MTEKLIGSVRTTDEAGIEQEQTEGLVISKTAKPKHVEEFSLREGSRHQPWEVCLEVQQDAIDPRRHETYYYVRAMNPSEAATLANRAWVQIERQEKGLNHALYPDTIQATAKVMDEKEWDYAWKEVQAQPHRMFGMKDNPSVFTKIINPKEILGS